MAYYFRAFCTAEQAPSLAEVLGWVRERGVTLQASPAELEQWGRAPVPLKYAQDATPFYAELNRNTGADSLCAQEASEFAEMVGEVKKAPRTRARILQHLQDTKYIVACRIDDPAGFSDAGWHAIDVLLAYFIVHSNGMIQADGQGFYEKGEIALELAA